MFRFPRTLTILAAFAAALSTLPAGEAAAVTESEAATTATPSVIFMSLPPIVANLYTENDFQRFLSIEMSIELVDPADEVAIQNAMPRVLDLIQAYLRDIAPEDLDGSAGMYDLRRNLLHRIRLGVAPVEVSDLLFREVLTQ